MYRTEKLSNQQETQDITWFGPRPTSTAKCWATCSTHPKIFINLIPRLQAQSRNLNSILITQDPVPKNLVLIRDQLSLNPILITQDHVPKNLVLIRDQHNLTKWVTITRWSDYNSIQTKDERSKTITDQSQPDQTDLTEICRNYVRLIFRFDHRLNPPRFDVDSGWSILVDDHRIRSENLGSRDRRKVRRRGSINSVKGSQVVLCF
jgi:hypothetical protein